MQRCSTSRGVHKILEVITSLCPKLARLQLYPVVGITVKQRQFRKAKRQSTKIPSPAERGRAGLLPSSQHSQIRTRPYPLHSHSQVGARLSHAYFLQQAWAPPSSTSPPSGAGLCPFPLHRAGWNFLPSTWPGWGWATLLLPVGLGPTSSPCTAGLRLGHAPSFCPARLESGHAPSGLDQGQVTAPSPATPPAPSPARLGLLPQCGWIGPGCTHLPSPPWCGQMGSHWICLVKGLGRQAVPIWASRKKVEHHILPQGTVFVISMKIQCLLGCTILYCVCHNSRHFF